MSPEQLTFFPPHSPPREGARTCLRSIQVSQHLGTVPQGLEVLRAYRCIRGTCSTLFPRGRLVRQSLLQKTGLQALLGISYFEYNLKCAFLKDYEPLTVQIFNILQKYLSPIYIVFIYIMLIHSHTDIFIIIQKHIMEAAHHTTGWQLGKVNRSGPLFELLSYSGYYGDVIPSQIALLNGKLRQLTIRHYKVIKMVMKRPTFKVNSISQLLSPLLMCHALKIELDKNDKQDILDLLAYIDSQKNRVIKICSMQVPYQAWNPQNPMSSQRS